MKTDEVKDLLKISKQIRIDRVIPKTEFFRALDKPDQKNLIRDNLNKLHWLASMKPENTNIPSSETFQEVEIFSAEIKNIKNAVFCPQMRPFPASPAPPGLRTWRRRRRKQGRKSSSARRPDAGRRGETAALPSASSRRFHYS